MGVRLRYVSLILAAVLVLPAGGARARERLIGFFVLDSDAYTCSQAVAGVHVPGLKVAWFTQEDIHSPEISAFIRNMDVAVVDIMSRQPAEWLLAHRASINPHAKIYAVRLSDHTKDYLDAGFVMDPEVRRYYAFTSVVNIENLIRYLANAALCMPVSYAPPVAPCENALYHPDAPRFFSGIPEYVEWYCRTGRYRKGRLWNLIMTFPSIPVQASRAPLDALIHEYEKNGVNTITWLRPMKGWMETLKRFAAQDPLRHRLGSITGFTFIFPPKSTAQAIALLDRLDVPVFNAQYLFFSTAPEWRTSPQGIPPMGVSLQLSAPELSGLVEPTVIGVKERMDANRKGNSYRYVPVMPLVKKLARRVAAWHRLREKPNRDKKIVLIYYNHAGGKQNIGASYLNVFKSIARIVNRLKEAGYTIEGELSEKEVQDLLIKSGRNVGAWAPGELDRLVKQGNVTFVSLAQYRQWTREVDREFMAAVEKDWGPAAESRIMMHDHRFVIPCIRLGNLLLAAQPVRGWSDDPVKLYHSTVLYPHHQYVAFYLWLQKVFRPDAMISLGTHGTHEWLPGKQTGLSSHCPPEVLIGDIPNIYPYIVDDVGEGLQAKRRGRAIVVDHATPPFRRSGLYKEYAQLASLISETQSAPSEEIRTAREKRVERLMHKLGLDRDLGIHALTSQAMEKLEHYLIEIRTAMIPYGLHVFGRSPTGEPLEETARAIAAKGGEKPEQYRQALSACGPAEMRSLLRALGGGYVPAGPGNDPLRNPESLPTGRDFYGFDPARIPSKAAWENGVKTARDLIEAYRRKHEGRYPEQIGLILWSVETIRDEGTTVATALALLGMKPVWDRRDKVKGIEPIPGRLLGRPRIDVLIQMSALFRDTFPTVALLLDRAVKQAALLDDVENFVEKHSEGIRRALLKQGYEEKEAKRLATVRIFSAGPGAYGTKVDDMAGASGLWEDDGAIAEHGFIDMVSYGYSSDIWGKPLKNVYRRNLRKVSVTVHTLSSNLYATMDNDDLYQYLGGLSMAVRKEAGRAPGVYVSMQKSGEKGHVESLTTTLGRELRTRYWNPKWIQGMMKEGYAGAREMSEFVENMWGWQVTTPHAMDASRWRQTFEVYVEDKYEMGIKQFFNRENPWAYQSITGRMLEAVRKGYWKADEGVVKRLACEYALNVVRKGVACCDHTCNNPLLNQMVVTLISLPGMLRPQVVEQFKTAVERASGKRLADQVRERKKLLARLSAPGTRKPVKKEKAAMEKKTSARGGAHAESLKEVEGYKLEEVKETKKTTPPSSSGMEWVGLLVVGLLLGLFFAGAAGKRKRRIP